MLFGLSVTSLLLTSELSVQEFRSRIICTAKYRHLHKMPASMPMTQNNARIKGTRQDSKNKTSLVLCFEPIIMRDTSWRSNRIWRTQKEGSPKVRRKDDSFANWSPIDSYPMDILKLSIIYMISTKAKRHPRINRGIKDLYQAKSWLWSRIKSWMSGFRNCCQTESIRLLTKSVACTRYDNIPFGSAIVHFILKRS